MEVLVLDKSGLWYVEAVPGTTFEKLHQSKLRFPDKTDFRHRARYLYFQFIMAMLRIGRSGEKGRTTVAKQMAGATNPSLTKVWATGGRYLRDNMIRAFIEGIGHDWP